jgi:hypothetical protein
MLSLMQCGLVLAQISLKPNQMVHTHTHSYILHSRINWSSDELVQCYVSFDRKWWLILHTYRILFKSDVSTAASNSYIFLSPFAFHFRGHWSEHRISEILRPVKLLHYVFQLLSVINCWHLSRENPQLRYIIHVPLHHGADFHISAAGLLPLAENEASSEKVVRHLAPQYFAGPWIYACYTLHMRSISRYSSLAD